QFGDPDAEALARLTLLPSQEDLDRTRPGKLLSPELMKDWQAYFHRFADFYGLDEQQRAPALAQLEDAKDQAARWLLGERGAPEVIRPFPSGIAPVKLTQTERVQDTKVKIERLRRAQSILLPAL